ncbi:sulfurtransferase [Streptomyces sp. NPDC091272]|uniref:sulfurtransferase n=1 Tax=Streptomyces sp. NPDC091272 TaxID=3365981 RepID=UPI0037F2AB50
MSRVADGAWPGPLVGVDWLGTHLGAEDLVVLDASVGAHRRKGPWIPGARIFDIDGEMSAHGEGLAPHTRPSAEQFVARVKAWGVRETDRLVVYDAVGIYSCARAWWMLRATGFERVAVLDGGLPGWIAAGLPVDTEPVDAQPVDAQPVDAQPVNAEPGNAHEVRAEVAAPATGAVRERPGAFVGRAEVEAALEDGRSVVLDARSRGRFAGTEPEPRAGLRAGHMPGAVNLPFGELQDGHGRMRPAAELRARFDDVADAGRPLVVSCGSGVTACVLALGAELAGRGDVSVYDGSWSEWGLEGAETPVATGEN